MTKLKVKVIETKGKYEIWVKCSKNPWHKVSVSSSYIKTNVFLEKLGSKKRV